jgi:hypothetical protein
MLMEESGVNEQYTKLVNTFFFQISEFLCVAASGTHHYHLASEVYLRLGCVMKLLN